MSASLVGSEMCIRDRPRPKRLGRTFERPVSPGRRWQEAPKPAQGLRPVSYTHLTLPTICSV
eukprot:11861846-Alexandrium_andersonii.AAC.1